MTVYYTADFHVNGGPPHQDSCPKFDGELDEVTDLRLLFSNDKWYIVDGATLYTLAEYPANQYHQALGYLAEYAKELYNLTCELIRPDQEGTT